jgi:hypothetical protein
VTPSELAEATQRCECFESLFTHPGWQLFVTDVAAWKDAISKKWQSITPDGLRFEQGRYAGLEQVTSFENLIAQLRAGLSESEDDFV